MSVTLQVLSSRAYMLDHVRYGNLLKYPTVITEKYLELTKVITSVVDPDPVDL
jgi:hypothetical protein